MSKQWSSGSRWRAVVGLTLTGLVGLAGAGLAQTVHPEIWPQLSSPVPADAELEQELDELLARLGVEEKVGQILQVQRDQATPEEVRDYHLGSVLNGGGNHPATGNSPQGWLAEADAFYDASMDTTGGRVAIPIIWGTDAVHGHNNARGATLFPHNIGLGATRNPSLLRRIGEITALEVAVTGLDWTFGPCVTVPRNDRWGRTYEGYSEHPRIHRALAGEIVAGLQGVAGEAGFLGSDKIIATAKHFLGDGGTSWGVDQGNTQCSEQELRDIHGPGYVAALGAGVQTVMASFSSWQGRKMHGNQELLTQVLKQRMGFDGFVIGDWNGHSQLPGCSSSDCPAAFKAGVDMYMVPYYNDWVALYYNLLAEVDGGEISMARLDDAVRRILRVKKRAGLFEAGRPSERPLANDLTQYGSVEHRAVARQAVRESLVLLKNDNQLLPLSPTQRVLVAGDGANNIPKQCGGWSVTWQGTGLTNADFPGATSIWHGIRATVQAAGGVAELSVSGSYSTRPDVAIVVYGEEPYAEGLGDRANLDFGARSPGDLVLLQSLQAAGVPVVSIFLSGRPLYVTPELDASDAFVAAWLPGTEGDGIAQVLFRSQQGDVVFDFVGRLAYSWPRSPVQTTVNWGDEVYDPLFPYGYGLSYPELGELRSNTTSRR